MSEEELKKLLRENQALSQKIYILLEKQRRFRMWMLILSIAVIVLPLIVAAIALPWMMNTVESYYGTLGL